MFPQLRQKQISTKFNNPEFQNLAIFDFVTWPFMRVISHALRFCAELTVIK